MNIHSRVMSKRQQMYKRQKCKDERRSH